jgi:MoaA/NifB/PqqE/SkfB family radical SAM enzyme
MRCNSRCAHCNIWKPEFIEQELATEEWLRALDDLRSWLGPFRMVFTGGEALLREDMLKILGHAVKLGISVELLSNGIMIDEVLAAQIVASGIDQITISLDGVTAEVHDRFRGGTGFHAATTSAILALVKERRFRRAPLNILLKTVISSNNLLELTAIANWAQGHDLEAHFQPIEQNYGEVPDPCWYRSSPLWISDLAGLREEFNRLRLLKLEGSCISNTAADFDFFYRYFAQPEFLMNAVQGHDTKQRNSHCPHAVRNFVIASNGDVRMCFQMKPIDNIRQCKPSIIWRERQRCWGRPCEYR